MEKVKSKLGFIIVLTFLIIIFIVLKCRDIYRSKSLEHVRTSWAIITNVNHGSAKGSYSLDYDYLSVDGVKVSSTYSGKIIQECHNNLKKGDTIYISYSISDPEVTEMIHCYWNDELRKKWLKDKNGK